MLTTITEIIYVNYKLTSNMIRQIKGRREEKKGTTEDEMVGWHPRLNGHEFEQAPGDSEGQ